MRLPWPFGRRTSPDGPSSAATGDGGADARPAAGAEPVFVPAPQGAWAALPPIQRTVGSAPLVAPSGPFLDEVPGYRPLPPILQPLGHDAGPSAPPGLVVAHARPVPSLTSHAPLPTRPVQHRTAGGVETSPFADDGFIGSAGPEAGASASATLEPERAPVRQLATVPPAATVTPMPQPLTRTTPTLAPLPARGVSRNAASGSRPATAAQRSAASAGSASRGSLPVPKAISRWAEAPGPGSRPGPAASTAQAASAAMHASPRRSATEPASPAGGAADTGAPAGASRRAGLGAPMPVKPASAVAQRLPLRPPPQMPAGSSASDGLPVPDAHAPMADMSASHGSAAGNAGDTTAARRLPNLPVAGLRRDEPTEPAPPRVDATVSPSGAAPGSAGSATRPLVGPRPLRPTPLHTTVTAQRASTRTTTPGATPTDSSLPVAVRWAPDDQLPATVTAPSGPGGPMDSRPPRVQIGPLAAMAPGPGEPAGAAGPREITFPPRDGTGSSLTGAGSASSAAADLQRNMVAPSTVPQPWAPAASGAGDGPGHQPVRTTAPPLALARWAAPASEPGRVAAATPVASRIMGDAPTPAASPTVQTSPSGGGSGTAVPSITATPIVQRVEGAAPAAEGPAEGHSDAELDELARALFGRLRTHLRAEVIHEREAKGLTFDAF